MENQDDDDDSIDYTNIQDTTAAKTKEKKQLLLRIDTILFKK